MKGIRQINLDSYKRGYKDAVDGLDMQEEAPAYVEGYAAYLEILNSDAILRQIKEIDDGTL